MVSETLKQMLSCIPKNCSHNARDNKCIIYNVKFHNRRHTDVRVRARARACVCVCVCEVALYKYI